jgi:hypothetical protein
MRLTCFRKESVSPFFSNGEDFNDPSSADNNVWAMNIGRTLITILTFVVRIFQGIFQGVFWESFTVKEESLVYFFTGFSGGVLVCFLQCHMVKKAK